MNINKEQLKKKLIELGYENWDVDAVITEINDKAAAQGWETGLQYWETGERTSRGDVETIVLDYTETVYDEDENEIEEAKAIIL